MSLTPILIFGAGGFAREVLQLIRDINAVSPTWDVQGFVVDSGFDAPDSLKGLPVFRGLPALSDRVGVPVVVAIGTSAPRRSIVEKIQASYGNPFATLIHPRAWIGQEVDVGEGSIICAGALITTDIRIGKHVQVNIGCTIGHDDVLHDFVSLYPRVSLSGCVELGTGVEVGTGAVLIPKVSVGEWSVIGAGSVVIKPLPSHATAVGTPAKVIKIREPHGA